MWKAIVCQGGALRPEGEAVEGEGAEGRIDEEMPLRTCKGRTQIYGHTWVGGGKLAREWRVKTH
jgi:hypothetical protein